MDAKRYIFSYLWVDLVRNLCQRTTVEFVEAAGEADFYIGCRAVAGDGVYSPDYDYLAKGAV